MSFATYDQNSQTLTVNGFGLSGINSMKIVAQKTTNSYPPYNQVWAAGGSQITNRIKTIVVSNVSTSTQLSILFTGGFLFNVSNNFGGQPLVFTTLNSTTSGFYTPYLLNFINFGFDVLAEVTSPGTNEYNVKLSPIFNISKSINSFSKPYNWQESGGILIGNGGTQNTIDIFQDPQCTACKSFNFNYLSVPPGYTSINGSTVAVGIYPNLYTAAMDGLINLILHEVFDDDVFNNVNSQSSLRATMAWACAADIDQGKYAIPYQQEMYMNQPTNASPKIGFTDEQLIQFATTVGINTSPGSQFRTAFESQIFYNWAIWDNMQSDTYWNAYIYGTPYIMTGGAYDADNRLLNDTTFTSLANKKLIPIFNN